MNTYLDGLLIVRTIFSIFKDYKPFACFSYVALLAFIASAAFGSIPIYDFVTTGRNTHQATAVLAATIALIAIFSLMTGVLLDSITRRNREMYQLLVDHLINGRPHAGVVRGRPESGTRPTVVAGRTAAGK